MMFKKKLLASAMATALVTGAMVSGGAQATSLSATSVGQLLLGDMYVARTTDYPVTRVKVINSDLTNAVKAKLVFRSRKHSDECRDLILYLTPGDVAYVDVRLNASGQPEIWSDDDSILASRKSDGTLLFASQMATGFSSAMVAPRTDPVNDTCAQGHIEVHAAYAVSGTVSVQDGGTVPITQGMSKHALARVFDTSKAMLNALNGAKVTNGAGPDGAGYTARVRLKGDVEIASGSDRLRAPMVAITSGTNAFTAVSTAVVTSPSFDVLLSDSTGGSETQIGFGYGDGGALPGAQPAEMLRDIEGALLAKNLFSVYEKGVTNAQITFPTKYRHIIAGRYKAGVPAVVYEAPFKANGDMEYTFALFDNQERSAPGQVSDICVVSPCDIPVNPSSVLTQEVNFFALAGSSTWNPDSGWFNLTLVGRAGADSWGTTWTAAMGAPVIGYSHHYKGALTQSVISPLGR